MLFHFLLFFNIFETNRVKFIILKFFETMFRWDQIESGNLTSSCHEKDVKKKRKELFFCNILA